MNRGFAPSPLLAPGAGAPPRGVPPAPAAGPRPSSFAPPPPSSGPRPSFSGSTNGPANFSAPGRGYSGAPPLPASQGARPTAPTSAPANGADKKGLPTKEESKVPSKGPVVNQQRINQISNPNYPAPHSAQSLQSPHLSQPHQASHPNQTHQQAPLTNQQAPLTNQQQHQTPPLSTMAQGQKRFGAAPTEVSEKKFRISPPTQQSNPVVVASLRADLNQKVNQTHPQDMAAVICSAVTGSCKEITDQFAIQLLEATFGNINRYLQPDTKLNLPMFADRVGNALRTELTNFFEKTFQTELVQLLLASTHQQPNVEALLRHKAMEIVHQLGDQDALTGMRAQIDRQQARTHPSSQPEQQQQPQQQQPQQQQPQQQFATPTQSFQSPVQPFQPPQQYPQQFQQPTQQPGFAPQSHIQAQPQQYGMQAFMPPQAVKVSNPQMETQLCNAALSGELVTVSGLLRQGVNINASQEGGWTALMNATLQGHLPVVKTLIDEKADLDLKDHGGFTALMYAASYNRVQIAEELVKAGASLDITDNSGRNITHYANDPQIKAAIAKGQQEREAAKAASHQMQAISPAHMMQMGVPQSGMQQSMMGMQGYRR